MVKHADIGGEFAATHGVKAELPALVLFAEGSIADTFDGDMYRQGTAVAWVKELLKLEEEEDDDD